jgi:hypothetical protein
VVEKAFSSLKDCGFKMAQQNDFDSSNEVENNDKDVDNLCLHDSSIDGSVSNESEDDDNGGTSVVDSDTNLKDANAEVRLALRGDDRSVLLWRITLKITMIIVAILLTAATYVQLSRTESNDFALEVSC